MIPYGGIALRPTLILTLLLLFSLAAIAQNQDQKVPADPNRPARPVDGAKIFQYYCASCHGADARGHGPAAPALRHSTPDLTVISQRNGGKFPYQQVKDVIAGKGPAPLAHGNREMPIWGPVFHQVESDQDWGVVRLEAITKYIASIQQK